LPSPKLLPQHLADLRASGLTDATVEACGFYSEADPAKVSGLLNCTRPYAELLGPCLVFPFGDAAPGHTRLKPDRPQTDPKKDRPRKYEAPRGVGNQAYFPPGTRAVLSDPAVPLLVTEGEKKGAKADQEGFPCVALSGVWNWCQKRERRADGTARGKLRLIPSLEGVAWQGRRVYIVFDSDVSTNDNVRLARRCLAAALKNLGAVPLVVDLPPGPGGEKQGLDDYLVAHTPDALRQLLSGAKPPEEAEGNSATGKTTALESPDDPHRLARLFLATVAGHPERCRLAYYREQFHWWAGRCWRPLPDAEFRGQVASFCAKQLREDAQDELKDWNGKGKAPVACKVTLGLVSSVLQALSGEVLIPQDTPQLAWLAQGGPQVRDYIALRNGILDVDALLAGKGKIMRPHSPRWFSPVYLPYDFDPKATCPKWLSFLKRNLGDGQGTAADKPFVLQQFFGYLLLPDTSLQRFLLMLGDGGNGKSVILAVIEAVLGRDNISSVPLEMFGDRFRLSGTLGKLANLTAEMGELDRVAEGQLKAFVSGDPMDFEVKFKPAITARPTARLVLATNNAPPFADKSDGLWRRQLAIRFTVQIPPADRISGMDKPEWWQEQGEMPGIFNWALAGLHQLRQQKGFTVPDSCQAEVEKLRTDANPARRFLTENYRYAGGEAFMVCEDIYGRYVNWCKSAGHHHLADIGFGREVARLFPKAVRKQKTISGAGRKWCYLGVEESPAEPEGAAPDAPDALTPSL
jgi:putative DNA primase/helicase